MKPQRIIRPIILAIIFITVPALVLAQGLCVSQYDWDFSGLDGFEQTPGFRSISISSGRLYLDGLGGGGSNWAIAQISAADLSSRLGITLPIEINKLIISGTYRTVGGPSRFSVQALNASDQGFGGDFTGDVPSFTDFSASLSSAPSGEYLARLWLMAGDQTSSTAYPVEIEDLTIIYDVPVECPVAGNDCSTVTDPEFTGAITDTWLLDGSAVITDDMLILGPGDAAAQNLTLDSLTTYHAVISTTDMVLPTDLTVRLGTESQTVEITGTGQFTASFTTPTLGGPIAYILENSGSNAANVDFTCLYPEYDNGQASGCLAPLNGTFEDDSHWNWYRGANWFYPAKSANLPVVDAALIGSTEVYTLPAITGTERILLGFTARGLGDNGVISGQVTNGTSTAEFNYSTYRVEYSYETDLSSLAEAADLQFSFVNPSDVITDIVSSADVLIDNICVFTATRGPNLPTPTDPNGITPVDPGLTGLSSCGQLDGIWAGFGVNMAQYRATYAAGASVWDPIGWVPWLVAAIFVTLGNWTCFFWATFLNLVDLITYFLNSVMNIGNWLVRNAPLAVAWLSLWFYWARNSLINFATAFVTVAAWLGWLGNVAWALAGGLGLTLVAAVAWLLTSGLNIINAVFPWLGDWLAWAAASLGNLAAWLLQNLMSMNGLRVLFNWFIQSWNGLLINLGTLLSDILTTLISLWNDSLAPVLADVWAFVRGMPAAFVALLIDFVLAAWDFLYTLFVWVWENVISVAMTPLAFYQAFDAGINADPYNLVSCASENFWCAFLSGVQLINQLIAHSILYPIIITGIILSTLWILWDNFTALFSPVEIR